MSDETPDSTTTQPEGDTVDATETAAPEATPAPETHGLPGVDDTQEAGDTDQPDEEATETTGAPEKYETFDISEGKDSGYAMSEEQHEAFSEISKGLGLTQEQAQELVKFDIERNKAMVEQNEKFVADYKADGIKASRKEHGEKYSERYAKNNQIYQKLVPNEDDRKQLNDVGTSSQPWFYNMLHGVSEMVSEDVIVRGDGGNDKRNNTLKDMFSDLNNKT